MRGNVKNAVAGTKRLFATNGLTVQRLAYWMVNKAGDRFLQQVKVDFSHLFLMRRVSSSMANFVPCDRLLKMAYLNNLEGRTKLKPALP